MSHGVRSDEELPSAISCALTSELELVWDGIYIYIYIYIFTNTYTYIYIHIHIYVGRTNEGKEVGNAGKSATESRCFRFGCVLCLRGADVPSLSRRFPSKSVISIIPDSGLFVLTERCDVVCQNIGARTSA